MKDFFKNKHGWIALLIFVVSLFAIGESRLLNRYTIPTMLGMIVVAAVIVIVLNRGGKDQ